MTSILTRQGQITPPGEVRRLSRILCRQGALPRSAAELDDVIAEVVSQDDARIRAGKP